jgi:hypothetical protein
MIRGSRTYRGKTKRNRRARKEDWGKGDQKGRKAEERVDRKKVRGKGGLMGKRADVRKNWRQED